jgi:hypothetical protein
MKQGDKWVMIGDHGGSVPKNWGAPGPSVIFMRGHLVLGPTPVNTYVVSVVQKAERSMVCPGTTAYWC